jgi:hypothetical protein
LIHLHKLATTAPKVRAAIQASKESASALAERYGTTEQTDYRLKHRDGVHDLSHTPHNDSLFDLNGVHGRRPEHCVELAAILEGPLRLAVTIRWYCEHLMQLSAKEGQQ